MQATYKVGPTKFGLNYGVSRLAFTNAADRAANPFLVAANEKLTGGVYYDLTKNLMLLGEISTSPLLARAEVWYVPLWLSKDK